MQMEMEIEELERALGQTQGHLRSLMRQKMESNEDGQRLALPDGCSTRRLRQQGNVSRPHPPPMATEDPRLPRTATTSEGLLPTNTPDQPRVFTPGLQGSSIKPRTSVKLPKYDGTTQLEPYLSQVHLAAQHSGWDSEEAATHLALALEGKAVQVLRDLAPAEQGDLQALKMALKRRFGQRLLVDQSREELASRRRQGEESLGTFAADVQLHARLGYPHFQAAAQEELALHAFLRGLAPEQLRQHVALIRPQTLGDALHEAERAEGVLTAWPSQKRTLHQQPCVRLTDYDEEEEAEEVRQVRPPPQRMQPWPPAPRRRPPQPTDRCYRCDEPGHIARNCPAPTPKPRVTSPAGNDRGMV